MMHLAASLAYIFYPQSDHEMVVLVQDAVSNDPRMSRAPFLWHLLQRW